MSFTECPTAHSFVCLQTRCDLYLYSVDRTRLFCLGRLPLAGHADAMCGAVYVLTEAAMTCDAVVCSSPKPKVACLHNDVAFKTVSSRAPCIVSSALTPANSSCRGHNAHYVLAAAAPLIMLCLPQAATLLASRYVSVPPTFSPSRSLSCARTCTSPDSIRWHRHQQREGWC